MPLYFYKLHKAGGMVLWTNELVGGEVTRLGLGGGSISSSYVPRLVIQQWLRPCLGPENMLTQGK